MDLSNLEFRNWLEMSSLRDLLQGVPQHPEHHPEGDVFTHERMVRKSMDQAIQILRQAQRMPNSSLAHIDLNITETEREILQASAWMHDIGKKTATTYTPEKGYQAIRHEQPQHYVPNMRKLQGSTWENIWNNTDDASKRDLFFIITHHMSLRDQNGKVGFGRRRGNRFVDENGFYKNERRVKLLMILIIMDRLGRGVADPEGSALKAIDAMEATAKERKNRAEPGYGGGIAAPSDPREFIKAMSGKPEEVVRGAFRGKFGREMTPEDMP